MYKGLIRLDRTTFLFIVLHFFSNVYSFLIIFYQISSFFQVFFLDFSSVAISQDKRKALLARQKRKAKSAFHKKRYFSDVTSALNSSAESDNVSIFKIGACRNTVRKSCDLYAERL